MCPLALENPQLQAVRLCAFFPLKASERRRKGEFLRGTHGWGGCVLVSVCVGTCVSALPFD